MTATVSTTEAKKEFEFTGTEKGWATKGSFNGTWWNKGLKLLMDKENIWIEEGKRSTLSCTSAKTSGRSMAGGSLSAPSLYFSSSSTLSGSASLPLASCFTCCCQRKKDKKTAKEAEAFSTWARQRNDLENNPGIYADAPPKPSCDEYYRAAGTWTPIFHYLLPSLPNFGAIILGDRWDVCGGGRKQLARTA
ncbi:hypothetical protein K469DRAFT_720908 [Zopfia rhizophila CBS 207.26]|uniref:Uncharacterized protein n=1 Tax=Zopfia rhizophila CBS 207.26 TaxID=1314779 RepID=A0A6A6DCG6_9PEZI|nr:hypothetical protein K469DRAFT_720908 [Zopfia rhizophila CBS 207.26]